MVLRLCSRGNPRGVPGPAAGFWHVGGRPRPRKRGVPVQRVTRTRARASANVGAVLGYQAARRGCRDRPRSSRCVATVIQPRSPGGRARPGTRPQSASGAGTRTRSCAVGTGERCRAGPSAPRCPPGLAAAPSAGARSVGRSGEGRAGRIFQGLAPPVVPAPGDRRPDRLRVVQPLPPQGLVGSSAPGAAPLSLAPRGGGS